MDTEDRVWLYVSGAMGIGGAAASTSVVRFGSGDRHETFQVGWETVPGVLERVVVRLSTRTDAAELEQVAREAAVLARLGGVAAPHLLDVSSAGGFFGAPAMCIEFVEGDHHDFADATPSEMEALGEVVGSLNARPVDDLAGSFPGPRTADGYVEQWSASLAGYIPKLRRPLPSLVGSRIELGMSAAAGVLDGCLRNAPYADGERLVLLHGDITPGNIVWSDRPVLIDWEYARLGDPADDVAYIFGQHELSPPQRDAFWSGYRQSMHHSAIDGIVRRSRLWEPVILLGSALWWLERWSARADADDGGCVDRSVPKPQAYYLEQALRRLDRFDKALDQIPPQGPP